MSISCDHGEISCRAPAKVNLSFAIRGLREDGYHEIESVMVPVSLYDELRVRVAPAGSVRISCRSVGFERVAGGRENLAYRAASRILAETGICAKVGLELFKRIPVGSGLGGGSSDAGAVFRVLPRLLGQRIPRRTLETWAAEIGADVAFFVACRPSIARGKGEILSPLAGCPRYHLTIVVPEVRVSTRWAYANAVPRLTSSRSDTSLLRLPQRAKSLSGKLFNDFEDGVKSAVPDVARVSAELRRAGSVATVMSGSGSAVLGLFETKAEAARATSFFSYPDRAFAARVLRRAPGSVG